MKALKLYAARDIRFESADEPVLESGKDVKIRVMSVGVCGSDISRYAKLGPYVPGMIWGHEFSGVVAETGAQVKRVKVGQKVTACPALYCGACDSCKKGKYAQCEHLDVIGARRPGAYAQYVVMPEENVAPVPARVDFDAAAMVEPSCVVLHGYYKTGIQAGDTVAVIGCGTIGLFAVQWAKLLGAGFVAAIDIDETKLAMAKEVGADIAINSLGKEPYEEVYRATAQKGADIAVESAGAPVASAQAFSLAGKGGKALFVGIPYGDVVVKRLYFEKIVRNELQVFGSWNAISAPFPGKEWETSVHFLASGRLAVEPMITHRRPLGKGPEMFEMTAERKEPFGKIIFHPQE